MKLAADDAARSVVRHADRARHMHITPWLLLLALLAPLAHAQDGAGGESENGTDTDPELEGQPGAQESSEESPGASWGPPILALVFLAAAGTVLFLAYRRFGRR